MKKRRGDSQATYVAVIFIFSLGILFAIYNNSGSQFQSIQGGTTITSINNAAITQVSGQFSTITTITNPNSLPSCDFFDILCQLTNIFCSTVAHCTSGGPSSPFNPFSSNFILGSSGTSVSGNSILQTLANPFNQAILALGTFIALGILAGLFGAGMLARVMVLAGLALSVILYIEGQLSAFSGMPTFIWWMFNGIMTVIMIIIVHEAFSKGGVG